MTAFFFGKCPLPFTPKKWAHPQDAPVFCEEKLPLTNWPVSVRFLDNKAMSAKAALPQPLFRHQEQDAHSADS